MTQPELDEAKRLASLPMTELAMHSMEQVCRNFINAVEILQKENERLRECVREATSVFMKVKHGSATVEDCGLIAIEHGDEWLTKYSDFMEGKDG